MVATDTEDYYDETDSGRYSTGASNVEEDDDDDDDIDCIRPEDSISMVNNKPPQTPVDRHPIRVEVSKPEFLSLEQELQQPVGNRSSSPSSRSKKTSVRNGVFDTSPRLANSEFLCDPVVMRQSSTSPQSSRTVIENQKGQQRGSIILPLDGHKATARCDSNDTLNSEMSQETVVKNCQNTKPHKPLTRTSVLTPESSVILSPDLGYLTDRDSPCPVHYNDSANQKALRDSLEPKNVSYSQERMYRVVLAGDAAVGKSSFILQLCTGYFHNRITSTLGVDFHNKSFDIDGKLTNLQLWDTAGQERFRAMAKSYFRRADGAILLYDATFEQSFIHVRDWVETIESGASRKIPIIICANKSDAIPECIEKKIPYVSRQEGEALARCYDATFMEVSAKEGDNVIEAVVELARQLWIAEDNERENGLTLSSETKEDDNKCCK